MPGVRLRAAAGAIALASALLAGCQLVGELDPADELASAGSDPDGHPLTPALPH